MTENRQNQAGSGKGKRGCLIALAVAVGVVVILVVGFMIAGPFLIDYMLGTVEKKVVEGIPADYDREKFDQTYEDFVEGVKSGAVTKDEVAEITNEVTEALADGELTKEELDGLIAKATEAIEN